MENLQRGHKKITRPEGDSPSSNLLALLPFQSMREPIKIQTIKKYETFVQQGSYQSNKGYCHLTLFNRRV